MLFFTTTLTEVIAMNLRLSTMRNLMRRTGLLILLVPTLILGISACGESEPELPETTETSEVAPDNQNVTSNESIQLATDSDSTSDDALAEESVDDDMEVDESLDELAALGDEEIPADFDLNGDNESDETESDPPSSGENQYQPESFGKLLRAHVSSGKVNYRGFKQSGEIRRTHCEPGGCRPKRNGQERSTCFLGKRV